MEAQAVDEVALVHVQRFVDLAEAQFHRLASVGFSFQLVAEVLGCCQRAVVGSGHKFEDFQ